MTARRYAAFLRRTYLGRGPAPNAVPFWPMLRAYMHNLRFRPALYHHRDRRERLAAARFPVLLVGGTDSDPFHREVIAALASVLPDVEVADMPGGHAPHLGNGLERFLERLARFHRRASEAASAT